MTEQTVASITITPACLPSPAIGADILFESHLHAGDEVAVPYGVEDAVAEFESKKILDNFFGKEVVYAIPVAWINRTACPWFYDNDNSAIHDHDNNNVNIIGVV